MWAKFHVRVCCNTKALKAHNTCKCMSISISLFLDIFSCSTLLFPDLRSLWHDTGGMQVDQVSNEKSNRWTRRRLPNTSFQPDWLWIGVIPVSDSVLCMPSACNWKHHIVVRELSNKWLVHRWDRIRWSRHLALKKTLCALFWDVPW